MKATKILAAALWVATASAHAADPVQIVVVADGTCRATVHPGNQDLKSLVRGVRYVYKQHSDRGVSVQSCEINAPKAALLERFSFCALAGAAGADSCWLSYNYAGGREIELSAVSAADSGMRAATCSFACLPR